MLKLIILLIPVIIIILLIKSSRKSSNNLIVENIGFIAKYCRNCGKEVDSKAVACIGCGVPPLLENKYCYNCGVETESNQVICVKCGVSFSAPNNNEKSKVAAALLAFFLGAFGAHKFYLGYTTQGIITLLVIWLGAFLFVIPTIIMSFIILIEGIIYLTKSDQEFQETYVNNQKVWF